MICQVCNGEITLGKEALARISQEFGSKKLEHFHADCFEKKSVPA
ncbi:MAG TPA: hypothetical protein VJJ82_01955 [Candidatus Nanoarchaeia archaeon]|nr:hypothetical protein [Candidatus Nanoarchaeia archaeon]